MTTFIRLLKQEFFPGQCYLCQNSADINLSLCTSCLTQLPLNQPCCKCCANPLKTLYPCSSSKINGGFDSNQASSESHLCGKCLNEDFFFDQVTSPYLYKGEMIKLVHSFKYRQKLFVGQTLGELFIRHMKIDQSQLQHPDILIPIPLYKRRIQQRGFNQALELARFFSKQTSINIDYNTLLRIKPTSSQRGLSANERRKNIQNAFAIKHNMPYKHIVLVDDVMTTGNTLNEAAKVLKKAGATKVDAWTIARA